MALTRPRAYQIYDIDYKQATRVVTVSNITLSGGAPNQVDGVNLTLKDRVLVTGQDTASQNGIYFVSTVGSGSNGTWTRSTDTDTTGEILTGTIVMVTEGMIYADTQWKLITDGVITVGITDQTWVQNYSANSISSGNSNVTVLTNSSVLISSAGSANVLKVDSNLVTITGNLIPSANITYSLGNNTNRFSDIWLSNTTIYLGNINVAATATNLTVNGANVVTSGANTDIQTAGNISAAGNITGNYFLGNVFYANGITASKIYNGTSEVNVTSSGGNVNVSIGSTSNVIVWSTTGEYVTGLVSASGNIIGDNILTVGLVSATGNATVGNISTAGLVTATGNVTGGNVSTVGLITATGNVTGGNVLTAGLISATANVTGGNLLTSGLVSATSNITGGNIATAGLITATGNIISGNISAIGNIAGNYYLGNGAFLTGITVTAGSQILNGNSNVTVIADSNVNVAVSGANMAAFATTGLYVTGVVSASGNVTGDYILGNGYFLTGVITSVANINNGTSNVTVVSSGGNITVGVGGTGNVVQWATTGEYVTGVVSATGNITGANILTGGLISATGAIYSGNIYTSGGLSLTGNTITSSGSTLIIDPNSSGGTDGAVVIAGNLSVQGNVTYIDSNVITTNEKSITLGNNQNTGTALDGAGIDIGNNTLAYWRFNNATTSWQSNIGLTPAANATLNLGGTSNYWATIYATGVNISGNITGGNLLTSGLVSATGNATAGNISTAGLVTATGNIQGGNIRTAGLITATGNVTGGNILTVGLISATGNVTGNYFIGNGSQLTSIISWTTQANTPPSNQVPGSFWYDSFADKKYQLTNDGTSNTWVDQSFPTSFSTLAVTGNATIGGTLGVTSNITGGNILTSGLISATGNVTGGNIRTVGQVSATGNVYGTFGYFSGNAANGFSAFIDSQGVATAAPVVKINSGTNFLNIVANATAGAYNGLTSANDMVMYFYNNTSGNGNIVIAPWNTGAGGIKISDSSNVVTITLAANTVSATGNVSLTGNITGNNILATGYVSAAGNIYSSGSLFAVTKSFLIDHPLDPKRKLQYGSLEGPENGVYVRGQLQGTDTIVLPDYWTKLVDPTSITVQLTPIGKHQKLYVKEITNNTVVVGNDNLFTRDINCFYIINAERADIEKLVVEHK